MDLNQHFTKEDIQIVNSTYKILNMIKIILCSLHNESKHQI